MNPRRELLRTPWVWASGLGLVLLAAACVFHVLKVGTGGTRVTTLLFCFLQVVGLWWRSIETHVEIGLMHVDWSSLDPLDPLRVAANRASENAKAMACVVPMVAAMLVMAGAAGR